MMKIPTKAVSALGAIALLAGCGAETGGGGITPQAMSDALHSVMEADRTFIPA